MPVRRRLRGLPGGNDGGERRDFRQHGQKRPAADGGEQVRLGAVGACRPGERGCGEHRLQPVKFGGAIEQIEGDGPILAGEDAADHAPLRLDRFKLVWREGGAVATRRAWMGVRLPA